MRSKMRNIRAMLCLHQNILELTAIDGVGGDHP